MYMCSIKRGNPGRNGGHFQILVYGDICISTNYTFSPTALCFNRSSVQCKHSHTTSPYTTYMCIRAPARSNGANTQRSHVVVAGCNSYSLYTEFHCCSRELDNALVCLPCFAA